MKSVADLDFSLVGIGILWNKGYFKQNFGTNMDKFQRSFSGIRIAILG